MARAIVAGHALRPRWRDGPVAVEGPDEDAFTLAVAAAEALLERPGRTARALDAIHLVGEYPSTADWGLPEAVGAPHLVVRRHGVGPAAFGGALMAALAPSGADHASLVLVVDTSVSAEGRTSQVLSGAAAIGFELADGPGLVATGSGGRRHPAHRPPDATAWSEAGLQRGGLPGRSARGGLQVVSRAAAPVLLAVWAKTVPGMPVGQSSSEPPDLGPAASVPVALGLYDLARRLKDGEHGLLATIPGEETHFIGLARTGATQWTGAWAADLPPGRPAPPSGGRVDVDHAVSEGAYVPRARYLENLASRWRFVADRCSACGTLTFPARGACRACRSSTGLEPVRLARSGTVEASTVVAPGAQPTEFDPLVERSGAYGVVLVALAPGLRVTLQVADRGPEVIPVGSRVTTELRRLYPMEGEWRYGRKAVAPTAAP